MNRKERRAAVSYTKQKAKEYSKHMERVSYAEWPDLSLMITPPFEVWRSCDFLAQIYHVDPFPNTNVVRISVCRTIVRQDGNWTDGITWDELYRVKTEIGYGDWYAIEVYPRTKDLVNVANLRHLWTFAQPLPIGWFHT